MQKWGADLMGSRVVVKDLGYSAVIRELSRLAGTFITVGVHGDVGYTLDGTPMVLVAAANELGTSDGRVPQRSFIRSTVDERRAEIARIQTQVMGKIADGKMTAAQGAGVVAQFVEAKVKEKVTTLDEPPNAPSTVAKKGSSNPLIDTGALRSAVVAKVIEGRKRPRSTV